MPRWALQARGAEWVPLPSETMWWDWGCRVLVLYLQDLLPPGSCWPVSPYGTIGRSKDYQNTILCSSGCFAEGGQSPGWWEFGAECSGRLFLCNLPSPSSFYRHRTCIMVGNLFPLPFLHSSRFPPEMSYRYNPISIFVVVVVVSFPEDPKSH